MTSLIEHFFDLGGATTLVIGVLGTPLSRAVVLILATALLTLVSSLFARFGERVAYAATVLATSASLIVLWAQGATTKKEALLLLVVAALNVLPMRSCEREMPVVSKLWLPFATFGLVVAEGLFFQRFVSWCAERLCPRALPSIESPILSRLLRALIPAGLAAALLFQNGELVPMEQAFRMDGRVERFATADYNWIQLDGESRYLFATGHSVEKLQRFDTGAIHQEPSEAAVSTGRAQGFAYDAQEGHVYLLNQEKGTIQVIAGETLQQARELPVKDLSPGDPWLALEPKTNTLTVVSEADVQEGIPFQVLDRETGKMLDGHHEDPGNVLVDPGAPRLYLGYFRRNNGVRVYDLATRKFGVHEPTVSRPDRLAFWEQAGEVLVSIPMESRVLRLKAGSLERLGEFKTLFGVRTFAIDGARQLLFCGGLATGMMAVLDMKTGRELTRAYVSPWLRTIQVDSQRQIAYLSAKGGLYTFDYRTLNVE